METRTATLSEFLLARISEDEAAAKTATGSDPLLVVRAGAQADALKAKEEDAEGWPALIWAADRLSDDVKRLLPRSLHNPSRVLAECEAKRRIVEEHGTREVASLDRETWGQPFVVCRRCHEGERNIVAPCPTLRALAAVYADHADYQQEWRP